MSKPQSTSKSREEVRPPKLQMTGWYDPRILIATAIRVAISTIFGQFADRREAIAASNAIEPQPLDDALDYSDAKGDFWFDYLADTGDGWDSTYAMARLVSDDRILVGGAPPLPRGKVLLLGGDQVYPFASREAYEQRFLAPFDEAYAPCGNPRWPEGEQDLYAIPGNHDWYDGLNAFFGLFCRRRVKGGTAIGFDRPGRVIAGRKTNQTRSYYALDLPGGWWLWATDAQLEGYIDQPQIDYFRHAARYWMEKGSKVILLVDGPSWASRETPDRKFENFSYLERLAGVERGEDGKPMEHRLKLVLTGDSHHYSRFTEDDRHYFTCGGGGAFLHPTHQLKDKDFEWKFPPPGVTFEEGKSYRRKFTIAKSPSGREALYPDRNRSRLLTLWNLCFAGINKLFSLTLLGTYTLFHWLLDFNGRLSTGHSLREAVTSGSFLDALAAYWLLAISSPLALLILAAWAAYIYAADARSKADRFLTGTAHATLQALVVSATICFMMRLLPIGSLFAIPIASAAAALTSATTYGLYLMLMLLVRNRHWNEAFSSFAHPGYKCMLRFHLKQNGDLTVYPVGLSKVPADAGDSPKNPELKPHLIEGPITIR